MLLNEPSVALYHISVVPRSSMTNFVCSATSSLRHMIGFLLQFSCLFLSTAQWYIQKYKLQAFLYSTQALIYSCISESVKSINRFFQFLFFFLCLPLWFSLIHLGHISLSLTPSHWNAVEMKQRLQRTVSSIDNTDHV